MKHFGNDKRSLGAIFSFLLALSLTGALMITFSAASATLGDPRPQIGNQITLNHHSTEPGLVISGYVRLTDRHGPGLDNTAIYRAYAAYPGSQIATSDPQGFYNSGYFFIPGDEMVTIWAMKNGYNLDPQQFHWHHYYGFESRELNFVATPLITNCPTPPSPNRILVDRGRWNTTQLNQMLSIYLGQGSEESMTTMITVTSDGGSTTITGQISPIMTVTLPLLANTLNHIQVEAKFENSNCFYITHTQYDFSGLPLTINQQSPSMYHLPVFIKP